MLIIASAVFLIRAVAGLVPLFVAVITCALELEVPRGHFISIAIALVAANPILFELASLRHAELLKPDLHCMLQLFVHAFDCFHVDVIC